MVAQFVYSPFVVVTSLSRAQVLTEVAHFLCIHTLTLSLHVYKHISSNVYIFIYIH